MNTRTVKIPNNLIKRCKNEHDGFTYKSLALFTKLKLDSGGTINGSSTFFVSNKFNINRKLVEECLPILIRNNLITKDKKLLTLISEADLISRFSDNNYVNAIDFSKCKSIPDYTDMLKISLIQLKISQIIHMVNANKDDSKDITKDLFVKKYIPDIDPDVNKCLTYNRIAKLLGEKKSTVWRMMNKHKKLGTLTLKTIFYDIYIEDQSIEIKFAKKIFENNKTKKTRVNYGSLIEISSITNKSLHEPILRYVSA